MYLVRDKVADINLALKCYPSAATKPDMRIQVCIMLSLYCVLAAEGQGRQFTAACTVRRETAALRRIARNPVTTPCVEVTIDYSVSINMFITLNTAFCGFARILRVSNVHGSCHCFVEISRTAIIDRSFSCNCCCYI